MDNDLPQDAQHGDKVLAPLHRGSAFFGVGEYGLHSTTKGAPPELTINVGAVGTDNDDDVVARLRFATSESLMGLVNALLALHDEHFS